MEQETLCMPAAYRRLCKAELVSKVEVVPTASLAAGTSARACRSRGLMATFGAAPSSCRLAQRTSSRRSFGTRVRASSGGNRAATAW
eukprot:53013-Chlamydomonas_euryale.AAC.1